MRQQWHDPAPADWIADRLHPFGQDVGSVIPEGFEAYARLFHPASIREAEGERSVSWAEVAVANARIVHPEMQWPNISGHHHYSGASIDGLFDHEPDDTLPADYAHALAEVLANHTTTPDRVWFAVWAGYGGLTIHEGDTLAAQPLTRRRFGDGLRRLRSRPSPPPPPTLYFPAREYYLFVGPLEAITDSFGDH